MTISNALPIQFWLNGEIVYNQTINNYVDILPYIHELASSEDLKLLWHHDAGILMVLVVYNCNGEILYTLPATEVQPGVYMIEFKPVDYPNMNDNPGVVVKIEQQTTTIDSLDIENTEDTDGFENQGSGDYEWNVPGYKAKSTFYGKDVANIPINVDLKITIDVEDSMLDKEMWLRAKNTSTLDTQLFYLGFLNAGTNFRSGVYTTGEFDRIEMYCESNATSAPIKVNTLKVEYEQPILLDNPTFSGTLAPWTNESAGGADNDWTLASGGGAQVSATSKFLQQVLDTPLTIGQEIIANIYKPIGSVLGNIEMYVGNTTSSLELVDSNPLYGAGNTGSSIQLRGFVQANSSNFRLKFLQALPSTLKITNVELYLVDLVTVIDEDFSTGPSGWSNSYPGYPWAIIDDQAFLDIDNAAGLKVRVINSLLGNYSSKEANHSIDIPTGRTVDYEFNVEAILNSGADVDGHLLILFKNAGGTTVHSINTHITSETPVAISGDFEAEDSITSIKFVFTNNEFDNDTTLQILNALITNIQPGDILGISDGLLFSDTLYDSILISYKTNKEYSDIIPLTGESYYNLRVKGVFFHEREITEQVNITTNSKVITTAGTVKKQKLFSFEDAPYYLHSKIQLILKLGITGSLIIDGVEWSQEEAYEFVGDRPSDYSMQGSEVWLTRKNFYSHNLI